MTQKLSGDDIAAIYAAAAEKDALLRIVNIIRKVFDVDSAGLWLVNKGKIEEIVLTEDVVESSRDYLEYYHTLDPWTGVSSRSIGRVWIGNEHYDENLLLKSEFYNDFAKHYGMFRPLGTTIQLPTGQLVTIGLNRISDTHLLGPDDKVLLRELFIHVEGALRLHRRFQTEAQLEDWHQTAFDLFMFGVVVCDADALVVYANEAAVDLARAGAGIVLGAHAQPLRAQTLGETAKLRGLVRAAALGRPGAMRLQGQNRESLSMLATPLPSRANGRAKSTKALICLSRNDSKGVLQEAALVQLFGLSPAQASLCQQLASGQTFEEAASERGIAVTTARTHFQTVLARTQTRNLRDLLRLLASLPHMNLAALLTLAAHKLLVWSQLFFDESIGGVVVDLLG